MHMHVNNVWLIFLTNRSESPSQVFFILLHWLLSLLPSDSTSLPPMILAYDNMCNLDRLRLARQPLPLPPPFDRVWMNLTKVIDRFHFRNHTSTECRTKYNPGCIKELESLNTQTGEQTFIWAGRFKKIVCSMPKTHHLFYLHRMVLRRNAYTERCYIKNKKSLLPKTNA